MINLQGTFNPPLEMKATFIQSVKGNARGEQYVGFGSIGSQEGVIINNMRRGRQVFNGPIGTLDGPNYAPVVQIVGHQTGMTLVAAGVKTEKVASFKLIALGADGKELRSEVLPIEPRGSTPLVEVTAERIERIDSTSGDVTFKSVSSVGRVKSASGDITVQEAQSVERLSTRSGDVSVWKCDRVGSAKSRSGSVRVVTNARDQSPARK